MCGFLSKEKKQFKQKKEISYFQAVKEKDKQTKRDNR